MTILALEFSSEQRSVAVARSGTVLAEASETGGYRATNAFSLVDRVLTTAKTRREDVEVLVVGVGPGSYTSIRAAIALAQGWQMARKIKLLGISSAEALVTQAQAARLFGRVNVVIDAQRGEYYLATWEVTATSLRELQPLKIASKAEITALASVNAICIGPETASPILFPTAATLAQMAAQRQDFIPGNLLNPIYLRETTFVKAPPTRHLP